MNDVKIKKNDPDWRKFEVLAVRMVSQAFKLSPGMVFVTHKSKDGGYDGGISHEMAADQDILGPLQELTFIEAKMRSGEKGIGLRDFAATMVIAHNEAANTLVVVANRPFTPQALDQACRFFSRTNMRVKLVDGATVSGWVRRNYSQLNRDFPKAFLSNLLLDDPEEEKAKTSDLGCSSRSTAFHLAKSSTVGTLYLESGWHHGDRLADCELTLASDRTPPDKENLPPLIGEVREKTLASLLSALGGSSATGNICLLSGTGGVGKSVLVSHLLNRLSDSANDQDQPWLGLIDVGRENSSRSLFVSILTALLGIDPRTFAEGEGNYWEPEALIARLGGTSSSDPICKAVVRTLRADQRDYESSWDLNIEPLLAFLGNLVRRRTIRYPVTLVFHELNRSTEETLDFLFQACRVLSENKVSILLEIRDSGYERTARLRTQTGATNVMPLEQWQQTVDRFRSLCTGGEFKLQVPTADEAIAYLKSLLPGLGAAQAGVIVEHVGKVPLHLKLTSDWHKAEGILARRDGGIYLVEDLEQFFAEQCITPNSVNIIFDRLIEAWWVRSESIYRQAITAMTLFQGELPLAALKVLNADCDEDVLADELVESGLFQNDMQDFEKLEVAHDLVLARMEVFLNSHRRSVATTARKLMPQLDLIHSNPLKRKLCKVELLLVQGKSHSVKASQLAHKAAIGLAHTRDWTEAARYYKKAANALEGNTGSPRDADARILELNNLAEWLEVEVLRYRIGSLENQRLLSSFLDLLAFSPDLPLSDVERQALALRASILEWRYHYVHEHFDEALRVAVQGRELALSCSDEIDTEIRGKALANYAVTLKVKDRREESFHAFDEALERLPNSHTVRAERLSNIAAFALRNDPGRALKCYRELLEITHDTSYSFSEIIHAHVDIAMADFLMGDQQAAEKDAQLAIKLAMDNGVPAEEARGRNILGCSHWLKGNVTSADREFQEAAFASERSISYRFLWRMRTNAAGTALALRDKTRAYGLARSAEEAIINPRIKAFPQTGKTLHYVTSRWYVALIAIASYYAALGKNKDLERLFDQVCLPQFREHAQRYIDHDPAKEVFSETTHLHGGVIMITG